MDMDRGSCITGVCCPASTLLHCLEPSPLPLLGLSCPSRFSGLGCVRCLLLFSLLWLRAAATICRHSVGVGSRPFVPGARRLVSTSLLRRLEPSPLPLLQLICSFRFSDRGCVCSL
eukprot:1741309-Pleurochrysis_carterae.AAC.1